MTGPPNEERPPKGPINSSGSHHTTTTTASEYIAGIHRRREGSWRIVGGDPWWYPPPGERGYPEAAEHLLAHGLTPSPNVVAMRGMWKRGGSQRLDAQTITERWGLGA